MRKKIHENYARDMVWEYNVWESEGDQHRWFISKDIVFEDPEDDKLWLVHYMHPATEMQDGQDRFDLDQDGMVEVIEVEKKEKVVTVEYYEPKDA